MSTRNSNDPSNGQAPDDFKLQNCTIEDVDRALFNLLNSQLPFTYKHKQGTKRAPVIFATGERFAVLRRKEPLRDKSGTLILPLISVMRKGINQSPSMGAGTNQTVEHTIKKRLSPEDPIYQRIANKAFLENSDDLASNSSLVDTTGAGQAKNSDPGRLASRAEKPRKDMPSRRGRIMKPKLGNNIFEVITMRPPKYFTATYEVTFWTQYTLQMNDMLSALMSLYQSFGQRSFKLETTKGYWFVGYVDESLTPGNNFDDFTDNERLVRYSFDVTVPAYLIGDAYPTSKNTLRKYVSAPMIDFGMEVGNKPLINKNRAQVPSADLNEYILQDHRTVEEPLPGQTIGDSDEQNPVTSAGGATTDDNTTKFIEYDKDPFTGKLSKKTVVVKTRVTRRGETVLREIDL